MSTTPPARDRVVKRGVILTCFVDGRKRFKAVPVNSEEDAVKQPDESTEPSRKNTPREPATIKSARRR